MALEGKFTKFLEEKDAKLTGCEQLVAGRHYQLYRAKLNGDQVIVKRRSAVASDGNNCPWQDGVLRLDHSNVAQLLHWEDCESFRYFLYKSDATSLRDFIDGRYKESMPGDVDALAQMASGVRYIHSQDLVHGNIAPDNVFICQSADGVGLKIAGCCEFTGVTCWPNETAIDQDDQVIFHYSAPEVLARATFEEVCTPASDIFSMGCVFYEFLTRGTHPFGDGRNILSNVLGGSYDLQKLPDSPLLVALIAKMIQCDPQNRPAASELYDLVTASRHPKMTSFSSDQEVGRGGEGIVYRSFYEGRLVAVKRVELLRIKNGSATPDEQTIMRRLDHPNVLKLFHWVDEGEHRFFVLELCSGTLEDYIKGRSKLMCRDQVDWLYQMARGLEYIHARNLVHRDLKPLNILLSKTASADDRVVLKISDFGFCKPTSDRGSYSLKSGVRGTQEYMAPELLKMINDNQDEQVKEKATIASDIFALGCVFFKFLTEGKHPYGGGLYLLINVINGTLSSINELSSDHLAFGLIRRMIDPAAENRPPSPQVSRNIRFHIRSSAASVTAYTFEDGRVSVLQCRFHPGRPLLACTLSNGTVCVFRCRRNGTGFPEWTRLTLDCTISMQVACLDWQAGDCRLAAGYQDGTVVVWSYDFSKHLESKRHGDSVDCIRWNGNDKHIIVSGSRDRNLILWDVDKKTTVKTIQLHDAVLGVDWISADRLACHFQQGVVFFVTDMANPGMELNKPNIRSFRLDASRDRVAVNSNDGRLKVYPSAGSSTYLESGAAVLCFDWHHPKRAAEVESKSWIVGGCEDSAVLVWEFTELEGSVGPFRKLPGHAHRVVSVSFSPDGELISSWDQRGKLIVWWTKKWMKVYEAFVSWNSCKGMSWSSSGNKLAVSEGPKVIVLDFDNSELILKHEQLSDEERSSVFRPEATVDEGIVEDRTLTYFWKERNPSPLHPPEQRPPVPSKKAADGAALPDSRSQPNNLSPSSETDDVPESESKGAPAAVKATTRRSGVTWRDLNRSLLFDIPSTNNPTK